MRTNWSTLSVPISCRMSRSVKVAAIKVVHWIHAEHWPVPFRLLARAGHHSYKITSDNNARYRYTISFCHLWSTNEFVFDRFRHWIHTSIGSPVTFCPATPTCQNEKKKHTCQTKTKWNAWFVEILSVLFLAYGFCCLRLSLSLNYFKGSGCNILLLCKFNFFLCNFTYFNVVIKSQV